MAMYMHFRSTLLHIISACLLLLLVIGVCAQDDPCSASDDIGKCGLNGICRVKEDNSFNCTCPPGFQFADSVDTSKGCLSNISEQLGCKASSAEMQELDRIDWSGNDYAHLTDMDTTACKQSCMEDCFCTVAIYATINGTENCWKKSMPLRNGGVSETRTAFVKVYTAFSPTPPAAIVPPTPSKERKEGKGNRNGKTLVIIGVCLVAFSIVFAAVFLIIWFVLCRPKLKALQEQ
ncbi:hypothetical protein KI387_034249, partial [Taxus chinensis]